MIKITQKCATFSVLMLEKSYLHQNGVELNFLFIGLASRPAISLRINPCIRVDSKGVGVCDLYSETRGGQYFAAEGRKIEGPPP